MPAAMKVWSLFKSAKKELHCGKCGSAILPGQRYHQEKLWRPEDRRTLLWYPNYKHEGC